MSATAFMATPAASRSGYPNTPVEIAGKAMDASPLLCVPVTVPEQTVRWLIDPINRPQAMDDMPVWQVVGRADHCLTGPDGRQRPTFLCQPGAGGAVYGTRHATAGQQLGIGGIHNHIHILLCGNIAPDTLNFHSRHDSSLFAWHLRR